MDLSVGELANKMKFVLKCTIKSGSTKMTDCQLNQHDSILIQPGEKHTAAVLNGILMTVSQPVVP